MNHSSCNPSANDCQSDIRLPENVRRLHNDESFQFSCHPQVECFNECCRQLDLALTPYDVLRLKNGLRIASKEFLDRFVIFEQEEDAVFPQAYLSMVDDGRGSCPFVQPAGCRVYKDRPGACRAYPLGRAAYLGPDGRQHDFHVLLTEPHCQGFAQPQQQTIKEWTQNQGLDSYNIFNDEVMSILQHEQIRNGMHPDRTKIDNFILAFYNLDQFRILIEKQQIEIPAAITAEECHAAIRDDDSLLRFSIRWLRHNLFDH